MQSSKRKRPDAPLPSSRRTSARGTPGQRRLNISTNDAAPSENPPKSQPAGKPSGAAGEVKATPNATKTEATETGQPKDNVGDSSADPTAEKKTVAQHQAASALPDPTTSVELPPSTAAQEKELAGHIAHRKILLLRVRQSKAAAEARLRSDRLRAEKPSDSKIGNAANGGAASSPNKEVEAFREMTKQANQAAKKQKLEENAQAMAEKRSSASLRRSSSMSKRASATLSSPALGGPAVQTGPQATLPQHQTIGQPSGATPIVPIPPPSSVLPAPNMSNTYVATKKMKTSSSSSFSSLQGQVAKSQQVQSHESGKGRRGSTQKVPKSSQNRSTPSQQYQNQFPSVLSKHPAVFDTAMLRPQRPPVYCPEAVALRDRIKGLTAKLGSIIDRKFDQTTHKETKTKEADNKAKASAKKKDRPTNNCPLPFRRRTHWDNVLEEMRWLSSDFVEERKWKVSSARTLGSAITLQASQKSKAAVQAEAKHQELKKEAELKKQNESKKTVEAEKPTEAETQKSKEDGEPNNKSCTATSTDAERIQGLLFPSPKEEEGDHIKATARVISDMVSELWLGIEEAGSIHLAQKEHVSGLERHLSFRKLELCSVNGTSDEKLEAVTTEAPKTEADGDKEDVAGIQTGVVSPDEGENDSQALPVLEKPPEPSALSHYTILEHVDKLTDRMNKRARQRSRTKSPYSKSQEPVLLPVEQKAYDFLDFIWTGRQAGGAILEDSLLIGAGEVVAALLRRHRDDGPHLVVCPPQRLLFWRQTLLRATGKEPLFWGCDCGISAPQRLSNSCDAAKKEFVPKDIVIVELSVVLGGADSVTRIPDMENFGTMVLDAFLPHNLARKESDEVIRKNVPSELLDESWWDGLLKRCSKTIERRVMISCFEMLCSREDDRFQMRGLSDRERLNMLAAQSAFVYGPYLFLSTKKSPLHRVLSWGKHGVKGAKNKGGKSKLDQIEKFMDSRLQPFRFNVEENLEPIHHSFVEKAVPELELRLCEMPDEQRGEYDRRCLEARGSLALGGDFTDAAISILELRKACFHSDLERVARVAAAAASSRSGPGASSVGSTSQPNSHLVSKLLSGSAKLQELVSFLRNECGYKLSGVPSGELVKLDSDDEGDEATDLERVSIIVSSIDSGRLVSSLLTCLGVEHNMLIGERHKVGGNDELVRTEGWTSEQLELSRFGESHTTGRDYPKVMVSTALIGAGQANGQNLESSDVIAILDEDWSGREQDALTRLTEKCLLFRARRPSNRDFRIIRFITEGTCEQSFVDGTDENVVDKIIQESDWSVAEDDLLSTEKLMNVQFQLPEISNKLDLEALFNFPAANITALQRRSLEDVLKNKIPMPVNLLSGQDQLFLPFREDGGNREEFFKAFAQELIHQEDRWKRAPLLVNPNSIKGVFSRRDCGFLSIRHYIGRNSREWALLGAPNDGDSRSRLHGRPTFVRAVETSINGDNEAENAAPVGREEGASRSNGSLESLLVYKAGALSGGVEDEPRSANDTPLTVKKNSKQSSLRANAFSKNFATAQQAIIRTSNDGSFGFEPLIYFPPLFPRAREALCEARTATAAVQHQYHQFEQSGRKRKDAPAVPQGPPASVASKRPRQYEPDKFQNGHQRVQPPSITDPALAVVTPNTLPAVAATIPSQMPLALGLGGSVPFDQSAQDANREKMREDSRFMLLDQNEDYGIMGIGATATLLSSSIRAANSFTSVDYHTNESSYAELFGRPSRALALCDSEELELQSKARLDDHHLKSVLLFVKKRPGHVSGSLGSYPPFSYHGGPVVPPAWMGHTVPASTPVLHNGIPIDKQNGPQKKSKKKMAGQANPVPTVPVPAKSLGVEVTGRPVGLPHPPNPAIKAKDAVRHKMLAGFGRFGYGVSMFESRSFRLASVHVRNRVSERVASMMRKKSGGGVPHNMENHHTTRGWYGPEQFGLGWIPLARRSSRESALALPKFDIVDYGPFKIGSVPSVSRFTAVSGPKAKTGVVLPMGVKLPTSRQPKGGALVESWTEEEDTGLRRLAVRFSMNWLLVSHSLGTEHYANSAKRMITRRSARQCRDRWELLTKPNVLLTNETKKDPIPSSDSARVVVAAWKERSTPVEFREGGASSQNVLPPALSRNKSSDRFLVRAAQKPTGPEREAKRSFANLRKAQTLKQNTSLTIPGAVPGQKLSLVASHPSHHQSLQAAVASLNTGGRTEMWPLQILDLADKQRGKQRAVAPRQHPAAHASVPRPAAYSSSPPPRQPHGRPKHAAAGSPPRAPPAPPQAPPKQYPHPSQQPHPPQGAAPPNH